MRARILIFLIVVPLLCCMARLVFWTWSFHFCNGNEQRASSLYFGEEWRFPPADDKRCLRGAANVGFAFSINDEVTMVDGTQGMNVTNGGFLIMTTPLHDDFPFRNSVYHVLDVENAVRPSMVGLLFNSSGKLKRTEELLKEKMGTSAVSNRVNVVRKPPYVGVAYRFEKPPRALLFVDNGKTNQCISIFIQKQEDDPASFSLEECCKIICASMEFK